MFSTQHQSRRRRADLSEIVNLVRSGVPGNEDIVAVPILLSFLREDLPWVYELGMEGYRQVTTGNVVQGHESFRGLLHLIDWAVTQRECQS